MPASPELQRELDRIASIVVDRSLTIHQKLGPGLLESAYVRILAHELRKAGLDVQAEVEVPLVWDGVEMGTAYRADVIVNDILVLELKATEHHSDLFARQLRTYLVALDRRLGLVINFGAKLLKGHIERAANDF